LHQIQAELGEKTKLRLIKVTNLIDVISSLKIQDQFKLAGMGRPFITKHTALHWLGFLGWQYGGQMNGMYLDGHEHKDVVQYRTAFMQHFNQYEHHFHLWDNNGEELPSPRGYHEPKAGHF
jgi:hypothetical protein